MPKSDRLILPTPPLTNPASKHTASNVTNSNYCYGYLHKTVVKSHCWDHWLKSDRANILHIRNNRRFKIGTIINNYFRKRI